MMKLDVPFYHQEHSYTCGPACLRMVLEYYGTVVEDIVTYHDLKLSLLFPYPGSDFRLQGFAAKERE